MKIEEIIKNNQGGTVLFLGRVLNFTPEELTNFLEDQGMQYADKYVGQALVMTVQSTMLTPSEEETSYALYNAKIPEFRLAEFEAFYTTHIKPNTLMMSLKLSNDQERLKRLLKNEAFSDEVFLKLFKMYDWGDEGVHENDDNRNATITFVKRFFELDGSHDSAMIYSPLSLWNIARDTQTAVVLDAMLSMPNHEIKQNRKEELRPRNLREIVALNPHIAYESIRYLLSFNDHRINSFLACNDAINVDAQALILKKADEVTKLMLTQNDALDDTLYVELLRSDDEVVQSLLTFQKITPSRLEHILEANLSSELMALMGDNNAIDEVVEKLIGIDKTLDYALASNILLNSEKLTALYETYADDIIVPLSTNPNLSVALIEKFYSSKNSEVLKNLAANLATPKALLRELCERNEQNINAALASNPSVELMYLQQFALDAKLSMLLGKNETYLASVNLSHGGMRNEDKY